MPFSPEAEEVVFINHLRGRQAVSRKAARKQEDHDCVGGMARTARCVAALPGNLVAGGQVHALLDKFVEARPELIKACCSAIGSEAPDAGRRRSP